jgi:hypothetical protein
MIRRVLLTCMLALFTAAAVLAAPGATLVLKNGERVSGTFAYRGGNDFTVDNRSYPQNDVAIIAFMPGDPSPAELDQLPATDNPTELRRNMIVMRDGRVVHGKLYNFSNDANTVIVDVAGSGRREFPVSDVARIYMSAPGARSVYNHVPSPRNAVATSGITPGVTPGAVNVPANQAWTDTGIDVKKGDRVSFHTSGQVRIAPGGNEAFAGPDGAPSDTGPRNTYPIAAMPAGGLIGRVGNSAPFPIGSNAQPITMPASGRLYLGINDSNYSDNEGSFTVSIVK